MILWFLFTDIETVSISTNATDSSPVIFRLCIYVDNIYSLLVGGCFEGDFVYVLVRLAYYCSLLSNKSNCFIIDRYVRFTFFAWG